MSVRVVGQITVRNRWKEPATMTSVFKQSLIQSNYVNNGPGTRDTEFRETQEIDAGRSALAPRLRRPLGTVRKNLRLRENE